MSLINDALKRAKQAQRNNPAPMPPDLQFRPAEPSQRPSFGAPILLVIAAVLVLMLGAVFVFIALQQRGATPQVVNASQPGVLVTPPVNPPVGSTPAPAQTPITTPALTEPAPTPTASVAAMPPNITQPVSSPDAPANAPNPTTVATPPPETAPADAATNSAVAVANVEPPKPAVPKLQGIFYRPDRPSAVINGKNVFVGSRVGDFRVLAITRESVTIGSATQTNVLSLAE